MKTLTLIMTVIVYGYLCTGCQDPEISTGFVPRTAPSVQAYEAAIRPLITEAKPPQWYTVIEPGEWIPSGAVRPGNCPLCDE